MTLRCGKYTVQSAVYGQPATLLRRWRACVANPSGRVAKKLALAAAAAACTSSAVASGRPNLMFSSMLAENSTCKWQINASAQRIEDGVGL